MVRQSRKKGVFHASSEILQSYEDSSSVTDESHGHAKIENSARSKNGLFNLDDWGSTMDSLYSARPGKRILFLQWLHQALVSEYLPEQVLGSCDILFSCLVSSIEKGSGNEAELACLCLAGVLLTLGQDQLNIADYKRISDTLKKSSVKGRTGLARLRSPLCFGILAFMGCNDDVYVDEANAWFLNSCTEIDFEDTLPRNAEPDAGLFNGALASSEVTTDEAFSMTLQQAEGMMYGWTLLATQWKASVLADWDESPTSDLLEFCVRCITRESARLRAAAGFALALLLESKWKAACAKRDFESTAGVLAELESKYVFVMDSMRDLGNGREKNFEKGLTKDERKNQKLLFRMFVNTAETGEGPSETLCLGSRARTTNFKSWTAYFRYDLFKNVLREALASHMISNPAIIGCVNVYDRRYSPITITHTVEIDRTAHSAHDERERRAFHRGRKANRAIDRRLKEHLQTGTDGF